MRGSFHAGLVPLYVVNNEIAFPSNIVPKALEGSEQRPIVDDALPTFHLCGNNRTAGGASVSPTNLKWTDLVRNSNGAGVLA